MVVNSRKREDSKTLKLFHIAHSWARGGGSIELMLVEGATQAPVTDTKVRILDVEQE